MGEGGGPGAPGTGSVPPMTGSRPRRSRGLVRPWAVALAVALVPVSTVSVVALVRHDGHPPRATGGPLAATPPSSTPPNGTPAVGHRPGTAPGRPPAGHLGQL